MNRKSFISKTAVLAGAAMAGSMQAFATPSQDNTAITVVHITDVHIRSGDNAPARFKKCLRAIIEKHKPAFFLNTGDSIHDASYDNVKRESVTEQWQLWDDGLQELKGYDIYSCIGNHDPWWVAPDKNDAMYGKEYVVKRLKIPYRYYSFSRDGWHFISLDGNNPKISLDEEQYRWLEDDLAKTPANTPTLVMSHYPILGTTQLLVGGGHSDFKKIKDLFYKHKDKVKLCLSGHNHLSDHSTYNDVLYCCNGAMSGFWWGKGDQESAGEGYYLETPPGYALLKLYKDGRVENGYVPHNF